ncbi:hypothetical protein H0Z60_04150 [Ectothiorhodospiraceae bacterium WFHF3C12]|nr:hypothetical protein [Ectothiorhodospiraceae bacterium WFHF3C12]
MRPQRGGLRYLFGSSSGLQFSVYRKDLKACKRVKLDWWESVWNECGEDLDRPYYREGKPVWRLEWRYHHSVVQQVQDQHDRSFRKYTDGAPS